jgi:hypothetical protein
LDTLYRLTLLKITQKATNLTATMVAAVAVCTLGLFVIFFASLGMAWWLGDIIKNRVGGFLIISGFYLLLLLVIVLLRKRIVFPFIRNLVMGKIYE